MCQLEGKNVLLTGASGGIGKAIARQLLKDGAVVALSGTNEDKLKKLAEELGGQTHILPCNLGDLEAVNGLVKRAEEAMGQVDVLVNNAGITKDGLAMRMSDEDFAQVLDVNLRASFALSRNVLRGMMKRKSGRIINISSVVGVMGNPGQANYVASKAGLIGLTKSFAQEVASRGITVNAIAPGFISSPMTDALNDDQRSAMLARIPAGDFGTPDDVAGGVAFLASESARYITGQTLHINGGMVMI